tara:strand:- start:509 stop:1147 length:639 start_codon:yes stop_codon:yes gene_type:complete
MKVDLYFSFRSPYSYLILPRILELRDKYGVEINFKLVYPLAIRNPEFFKSKNFFTYFLPRTFDYFSQAKKLGMKFRAPKPDPINQSLLTGKISDHQPYIFYICHVCQMICKKNLGLDFAYEVSKLIFGGVKNWNKDEQLAIITSKFGVDLNELKNDTELNEKEIVKEIKKNQEEQILAGHHGVPMTVYKGKFFFGQDRFNDLMTELRINGLK